MLHLDDEIAGLLEAAAMPADQDKTHSSQPDAVSPVPGEMAVSAWYTCRCTVALAWLCAVLLGSRCSSSAQCMHPVLPCHKCHDIPACFCQSLMLLVICTPAAVCCQPTADVTTSWVVLK